MVLAKSKNAVGLGNSLMNDRFGKGKGSDMRRGNHQAIQRTGVNGEKYVTNGKQEASWVKMRSVTEQAALDEFLSTAELADTDFTAEKLNNVKIIQTDQKNPYLLSAAAERASLAKQNENRRRLTVPRRPAWDERTTPQELDTREREAFLDWRRGLAELQESDDLLLTPFERNLEVWRQLWRVIERSDLVVQIVDARNPLLFRSVDLERYVKEVDSRKTNLLLINKADMMTYEQRLVWADYLESNHVEYKFFSAQLSKETNEARLQIEGSEELDARSEVYKGAETTDEVFKSRMDEHNEKRAQDSPPGLKSSSTGSHVAGLQREMEQPSEEDQRTRIISVEELENLFTRHGLESDDLNSPSQRKISIGMVGYPNVGKSSTINALIGAKKVSVSATPGKTKHFQTIHLSDSVILCDCPGLVFPNFATTKAELVCCGVLPIDQLREFTGPASLIAQRIPQNFLEAIYGIKIRIRSLDEGGTGVPTAEEILKAYAAARGFYTQGLGQPDESRASRYVLKDYVKGKLLFCHPPPHDPPMDELEFNRKLYDLAHLPNSRRAAWNRSELDSRALNVDSDGLQETRVQAVPVLRGEKSIQLDKTFFGQGQGGVSHSVLPYQYHNNAQGVESRKQLSGRKQMTVMALEAGVDAAEMKLAAGKKHFNGNKRRGKHRAVFD